MDSESVPNQTFAEPLPSDQPFTEPSAKKHTYIKWLVIIVVVLFLILGVVILVLLRNRESNTATHASDEITSEQNSDNNQNAVKSENPLVLDQFEELVSGGDLEKTVLGFHLDNISFSPVLNPVKGVEERINNIEDSDIWVELIDETGAVVKYPTTINFCPENTDVCQSVARVNQLHIGDRAFLSPVIVEMTPKIKSINFVVNGTVIKQITRPTPIPQIINFQETEQAQTINNVSQQGQQLSWEVENQKTINYWYGLQAKASEADWYLVNIGSIDSENNDYFFQPSDIKTTLDQITFRLSVTDGFRVAMKTITSIRKPEKVLNIRILNYDDKRSVGQSNYLRLEFVDPETGQVCDQEGCLKEGNGEKYRVTWQSNRQNVCVSDIFKGILQYTYKVSGEHQITAIVRGLEKPELSDFATATITVDDSPYDYTDNSPGCSY